MGTHSSNARPNASPLAFPSLLPSPQQTHTVRIKCAAAGCEEVDLCPSCFCKGKEAGKHKRWHPYKVVVSNPVPFPTSPSYAFVASP